MRKTKSLPKLKADCQKVFNSYIRERDKDKPCISSGKMDAVKQAGHFFPVSTFDGIRFDEDNVHGESTYSNCFDEGHLIPYRDNLLLRIGKERFDALYRRAEYYKKNGYRWSRSELIEKIQYYKDNLK